jgi:uncharacterized protein (DUF1800 family)/uncharacterized protein (DUF1501 family)
MIAIIIMIASHPAAGATAQTFATSYVQASIPRGALGRDAGIELRPGYVRVSASGAFSARSLCGGSVGPDGCGGGALPSAAGTLLAVFVDAYGRTLSAWMPVGAYANLTVPLGAKRLLFRASGLSGREYGAYRVVSDVVASAAPPTLGSAGGAAGSPIVIAPKGAAPATQSLAVRIAVAGGVRTAGRASTLSTVGNGPSTGVIPGTGVASRSDVHYALRRLGFSDTPAAVTAALSGGVSAWVTAQLAAPTPAGDTSIVAGGNVEALPVLTGNSTTDGNYSANIEDRLMQWEVNTRWQLREKITLHWLEHFAVSEATVGQSADMEHYIQTIRADALGNFAKLLADVSKEPAVMIYLNNANNGYNPNIPPNENFGREIMQLYSLGVNVLNSDGSVVLDPNNPGQPLATYTEADVKTMALALTGFQLQSQQAIGTYPAYVDSIAFNAAAHAPAVNGGFLVMGQTIPDGRNCPWTYTTYLQTGLNTSCVVDNVAYALANNSTTWAYESRELLERLVNEQPSAAMIKRISTVWGQTVNDPNQIGKVIAAIAADPEFYAGKYTMIKEPIEFEVDAIRAFGGAASNPVTASVTRPLANAINDTARMAQELWDPPSVFSFYYPGLKDGMLNNAQLLATWASASDIAGAARTTACTTCSIFLDFTAFSGARQTTDLAGYLLDALVDGGTPQLNALVKNFLNNNPSNVLARIRGQLTMFTRRKFLCGAAAVTMSTPAFLTALARNACAASNTILVVYELNGGNDAFNMVIPWDSNGYGVYQANRANIAISVASVIDPAVGSNFDAVPSAPGNGTTFAFNPTMSSTSATNNLRALYGQGRVAVIMGLGLPANAVSRDGHQQAQFYWQTAAINNLGLTNLGWTGLAFDQLAAGGALPPLVTVDGSNQVAFHGSKNTPLVVNGDISNFSPNYPSQLSGNNTNLNYGPAGTPSGLIALNADDNYPTAAAPAEFTRSIGTQTIGYVSAVKSIATAQPLADYALTYNGSNSGVKSQFKQIARMILGGAATRAYYLRQGGYDTHSAQNSGQPALLGEFSESVTEFYTYLKAKNASSNVVIMTISDFGRRPYSNSSAGTDHGTATMHFMIGDPVAGGTYFHSGAQGVMSTGYPNIATSALDSSGNVYVSIDYRYYLSAALQWLGADPTPIVGSGFVSTSAAGANLNALLPGLR